MQFTTNTQALRQALTAVSAAIPSKPAIQILNNILVEANEDALSLTACNNEQTITMRVKLTDPAPAPVKFLVNARDIKAIASAANFDTMVLDYDAPMLNIGCGFSDFSLPTLPIDEFPTQSAEQEPTATITLQSNDVRVALSRVAHAVGTEDLRPQMKGVFFDFVEGKLTTVATDTRILAKCDTAVANTITTSMILPSSAIAMLQGAFLSEPEVTLSIHENGATFICGENKFTTTLIKGNFPPYNRVIPQTYQYEARFNRKDFVNAVNSTSAISNTSGMIKLAFTSSECVVSMKNTDYQQSAKARCKCDFSGGEMNIYFNIRYLQSALKSIETEEVVLRVIDNTRPGVFVGVGDDNTLNLLMPMNGNA